MGKKLDSSFHCIKCGEHVLVLSDNGRYLKRTNPKGEKFIGECVPACGVKAGDQEDAVVHALMGD